MAPLVRPAAASDAAFLAEMLVAAAFWRPDGPGGSVAQVLADPRLAHYVVGWPRAGDLGVVAVDGGRPVGAAWLRLLPTTDPGYGFVDAGTPELSVGVRQQWRGRGVGSSLLDALLDLARARGLAAVSLSVEPDNPARRLYERRGFRQVGEVDGSPTMLLRLDPPAPTSGVALRVRFPVEDAVLSELHRQAFGGPAGAPQPWAERLRRHSLTWVGALDGGDLVGFVNVCWDGGSHAFVLDTVVRPDRQRRGIGRDLLRAAVTEARRAGCEWLHVDHEPHLQAFYRDCGFRPTAAGLVHLTDAAPR